MDRFFSIFMSKISFSEDDERATKFVLLEFSVFVFSLVMSSFVGLLRVLLSKLLICFFNIFVSIIFALEESSGLASYWV